MSAVRSEVEELKDKIAKLEVSSKVYFACWNCILELWLHFHYSGQPADVSTGEQLSPHERDPGSARDHAQLRPARPAWSTAPQLSTSSGACPPCSTATSALKLLPHLSLIWRRTISYKVPSTRNHMKCWCIQTQDKALPGTYSCLSTTCLWPQDEFIQLGG